MTAKPYPVDLSIFNIFQSYVQEGSRNTSANNVKSPFENADLLYPEYAQWDFVCEVPGIYKLVKK